jgi:hypothetical protein
MDKVRNPNISVCYTPSSEPYSIRIYCMFYCFWRHSEQCYLMPHATYLLPASEIWMPHVVAGSPKIRTVYDILGCLRNFGLSPKFWPVSETSDCLLNLGLFPTLWAVSEFVSISLTLCTLGSVEWGSPEEGPIKLINNVRGWVGHDPAHGTSDRATERRCSGRYLMNLGRGVTVFLFQGTHWTEVGKWIPLDLWQNY